jgi:UDP-N-acetylglucosamine 2-epimerase (non-hydrolysing)
MSIKIISVVGARPNFMKMAAICEAINEHNNSSNSPFIDHLLVHTGQHYDSNMSDLFFSDLELPKPDLFLGVGSGSHAVQTAKVMESFESVLRAECPDVVLVVGDVNSTLACALATKKTWCAAGRGKPAFIPKLAHVEAGLRSFDRTMPEEINRILTDTIADYLFTTEESATANLDREGISSDRIHFVGNVMIDTLLRYRSKAEQSSVLRDLNLVENNQVGSYAILTLHRPGNVEDKERFTNILEALVAVSRYMPIIFPAHPRTRSQIEQTDLGVFFVDNHENPPPRNSCQRIRLLPPLGYLDFLNLISRSKVVLTDSGGIQEETTIMGVPCITLRENTERPITVQSGTNVLVGAQPKRIIEEFLRVLEGASPRGGVPPLWDGKAAKRIIKILCQQEKSEKNMDKESSTSKERKLDNSVVPN